MTEAFGPAHFADMDQSLDAVFKADEGAVVHHVYHFAFYPVADRIIVFDIFPWAAGLLL